MPRTHRPWHAARRPSAIGRDVLRAGVRHVRHGNEENSLRGAETRLRLAGAGSRCLPPGESSGREP